MTPTSLLHTSFGQPTALTPLHLGTLGSVSGVGIRMGHMLGHESLIASSGRGMSSYCNLGGRSTLLSVRDPWREPSGDSGDGSLSVEQWGGRRRVRPSEYAEAAVQMGVDAAVTMPDEVAFGKGGKNRVRAATTRSAAWAGECLSLWRARVGAPSALAFIPCPKEEDGQLEALAAMFKAIGVEERVVGGVLAAAMASRKRREVGGGEGGKEGEEGGGGSAGTTEGAAATAPSPPAALPKGVLGFVLGGWGFGEAPKDRAQALGTLLPYLPSTSLRVLPGVGAPWEVIDAVSQGIDVFDCDYPGLMAHFGYAAGFVTEGEEEGREAAMGDCGFVAGGGGGVGGGNEDEEEEGGGKESAAPASVAAVATVAAGSEPAATAAAASSSSSGGLESQPLRGPVSSSRKGFSGATSDGSVFTAARGEWALKEDSTKLHIGGGGYKEDWRPLVVGCKCFACGGLSALEGGGGAPGPLPPTKDGRPYIHAGHHRAYIHHLLNTKEILGTVLLTLHNTYQYAALFEGLRKAIKEGRLEAYSKWLKKANRWV